MKKKEWLVKNGYLPKGSENVRGRLSGEHVALIEAAVAGGEHIEGFSVVSKPTAATDKPTTVERVKHADTIADTPEETVPEQFNIAMVGDKVIGNRTVCDVCKRSLNFHICQSPRVMDNGVSSVVSFKPRPNAENYRPNRWW